MRGAGLASGLTASQSAAITGNWTFSGTVGIGTSSPALLNGVDYGLTFQVVGAGSAFSGTNPTVILNDTSRSADSRLFDFANIGGRFYIRHYNDAGTVVQYGLSVDRSTNSVGIGTSTPDTNYRCTINGPTKIALSGEAYDPSVIINGSTSLEAAAVHIFDVDVEHGATGDLYGILSQPSKADTFTGTIIAIEGYLSNSAHAANSTKHYGLVGDCRSAAGAYTGTYNFGLWTLASGAANNIGIYGATGYNIFNDRVGIGLYDPADADQTLRITPVLPSYPFHMRDRVVLAGNESATAYSFYIEKVKDGSSGTYSENAPMVYLKRTITNVSAENGSFLVCNNGSDVVTISKTGFVTLGSGISIGAGNGFEWTGRGYLAAAADGVFVLSNAAGSDFTRLDFGGTTSSFGALARDGAGVKVIAADGATGAFLSGVEQAEPAAPAENGYRIFAVDSGGKTVLKVRFASGASQVIATEP